MEITINLETTTSKIIVERGAHTHIKDFIQTTGKVMVITDCMIPESLVNTVMRQLDNATLYVTPNGEEAKSFTVYEDILKKLLDLNFSRKDLILALGGGVIGDLSGYVAATFKRGMRFASIPTSTLSQIDSSIGGKVAINLNNVKNVVGTFYHPQVVLIDMDTLKTLPKRHYNNGLVEAVKAGLIADSKLFELFENYSTDIGADSLNHEEIIIRALLVKKKVVEADEKEMNLRKILNFGHTFGHAIESIYHLHDYYHGECVALGMLQILDNNYIKNRLAKVITQLEIPLDVTYDMDECIEFIKKDKKAQGNRITIVQVNKIGEAILEDVDIQSLRNRGVKNEK